MEQLSIEQLDRVDLVEFLAAIGIDPKKRKGYLYSYLSPLAGHPQHNPTFIVNRNRNTWRETKTKQAGTLSDLVVRLYDCTIGELTAILRAAVPPVQRSAGVITPNQPPDISIYQIHNIRSTFLEQFLWERRIPVNVAREYLSEAWYYRGDHLYSALAFPNDAGGFELFDRNHYYRVPLSGPTHIRRQSRSLAVFHHVLDLLTYIAIVNCPVSQLPDFLVLNGPIAFFAVERELAEYADLGLFLPNNASGILFSTHARRAFPKCLDNRFLYRGYAGLNDWICRIGTGTLLQIL